MANNSTLVTTSVALTNLYQEMREGKMSRVDFLQWVVENCVPDATPTRGLPLDSCIYGLRNLSVMDDEQTRIDSELHRISDLAFREEVSSLVGQGKYEAAYELALRPTLESLDRETVAQAAIIFALSFVEPETIGDGDDPLEQQVADLVHDIMGVFDGLTKAWKG